MNFIKSQAYQDLFRVCFQQQLAQGMAGRGPLSSRGAWRLPICALLVAFHLVS